MDTNKLDELAEFILQTLQEGKDFIAEEAPLVLQEFVHWKIAEHSFWLAVGVGIVLAAWLVGGRLLVKSRQLDPHSYDPERDFAMIGSWFLRIGGAIGGTIVSLFQAFYLLQIIVAPRVYLLEWAMQRVR